jgi:putative tryptophan/tyrosine transport system substrate-binding protein
LCAASHYSLLIRTHHFTQDVLNRPGGNITGVSLLTAELVQKRLELSREVVPNAAVVAMLVNPNNPNAEQNLRLAQEAARVIGLQLVIVKAGGASHHRPAAGAGALVIAARSFL